MSPAVAQASVLLDPIARSSLDRAAASLPRAALAGALHAVYVVMTCVAAVGAMLAVRLPHRLADADRLQP